MADDLQAGELLIQKALNNGKALQKFQEMLISQDVSLAVATELCSGEVHSVLSYTKHCTTLCYTGVPGRYGFVFSFIHCCRGRKVLKFVL